MNSIRTRFVPIGNSRGLRVPKVIIEQLGLGDEVELTVESDRLVVQAAQRGREGWDEAFKTMARQGDDTLLEMPQATKWDRDDWQW